jgi:hypothetical protein
MATEPSLLPLVATAQYFATSDRFKTVKWCPEFNRGSSTSLFSWSDAACKWRVHLAELHLWISIASTIAIARCYAARIFSMAAWCGGSGSRHAALARAGTGE